MNLQTMWNPIAMMAPQTLRFKPAAAEEYGGLFDLMQSQILGYNEVSRMDAIGFSIMQKTLDRNRSDIKDTPDEV